MKLFTTAAIAILLSSGMAFAQDTTPDNTQTGSTGDNSSDPSDYLAGPNIHRFYTDETMTTLRPEADLRSTFMAMSAEERANLIQACQGPKDNRFNPLCSSISTMQ